MADTHMRQVVVIGPTPPPYTGMSVATDLLLDCLEDHLLVARVDTADRRGLANVGRVDFENVRLAFVHFGTYMRHLATHRPSVVYVPISQSTIPFLRDCLFLVPARLLRIPIVVHLHGGYFREFYRNSSRALRLLVRFVLRRTRTAIVLGESLQDQFEGIIPSERVEVVPNGLRSANRAGSRSYPPQVLFLSALHQAKGVLDLISAAPAILSTTDASFVFAGEWTSQTLESRGQRMVDHLGIGDKVRFVGAVGPSVKERLLAESSVFVLPTYYRFEGQPFSILEAMRAGLPVVTTAAGCILEVVRDGETGIVVPSRDPDRLAEAIASLLSDPELCWKLGGAGKRRFEELYSIERWCSQMREILDRPSVHDRKHRMARVK